jgi:hypothetical protein
MLGMVVAGGEGVLEMMGLVVCSRFCVVGSWFVEVLVNQFG